MMLDLPPVKVRTTIREYRTCEFATLARDGMPIALPVVALYQPPTDDQPLVTGSQPSTTIN